VKNIKHSQGIEIDISKIDDNDAKVFELISSGRTEGIFQLESEGMKNFMKELKPESLEDVIAGISLYRPGPMDFIPAYIKGKENAATVTYDCPELDPILKPTYGVIVYQEQVMQIVRSLAGYSYGRADLVRRAMSKKKEKVMQQERQNFVYGNEGEGVQGCVNNGISAEVANLIFDKMTDFAKYAFNKSHAAAYAIVAYQTGWLKAYYPVEFMAALLTSVMFAGSKVAEYIHTLRGMNIQVLPPDVNEGFYNFSVSDGKIRYGMAAVKNVGRGVVDNMVLEREANGPFLSLTDYCSRMASKDLNKRTIENLIKAGAFQSLGGHRKQYLDNYVDVVASINHQKKSQIAGQMNLFDLGEDVEDHKLDQFEDHGEIPKDDILTYEKEVLGIYLSGHPLEAYDDVLTRNMSHRSLDFLANEDGSFKVFDGQDVRYGGIISTKTVKTTRTGQYMAFIGVEDLFGIVEVVVFPKDFDKARDFLDEDAIVIIKGRVSTQEDQDGKIICRDIKLLEDVIQKKLWLQFDDLDNYKATIKAITPVLKESPGKTRVMGFLKDTKRRNDFGMAYNTDLSEESLYRLQGILGEENVKVVKSLAKF